MEPPGAHLPARRAVPHELTVGAAAAAGVLALASAGDVLLLAVVLGVASARRWTLGVAVVAALSALARWGTSSMAALAGAQSVLGPGVLVGPALAASSSALAAAALVLAPSPAVAAPAFGAAAAAVAFGPAVDGPGDLADLAVRLGATALATAAALGCGRLVAVRHREIAAATAAVAALVAGMAA